jgi:3-deoxy-D-arabino-heptulosonate 7-phosphate (DAHP) synthase
VLEETALGRYREESDRVPVKSTEERMIKFQREVAKQAKEEVVAEVSRIRQTEVAAARLDERAK